MPRPWTRYYLEAKGVMPLNKGNKEGNIGMETKAKRSDPCPDSTLWLTTARIPRITKAEPNCSNSRKGPTICICGERPKRSGKSWIWSYRTPDWIKQLSNAKWENHSTWWQNGPLILKCSRCGMSFESISSSMDVTVNQGEMAEIFPKFAVL